MVLSIYKTILRFSTLYKRVISAAQEIMAIGFNEFSELHSTCVNLLSLLYKIRSNPDRTK